MQHETNKASAVLAVWTDAKTDADADFNEWYNRQHVNERCDVPGFLSGRRYRALSGRPRYMALYDTIHADVLSSQPYRTALDNPTPWTRRIMPSFQGLTRAVLNIRARLGRGYGSVAASIRPAPGVAAPAALVDWLISTALPSVLEQPGVTSAQFLEAGDPRSASDSTEGSLRGDPDSSVEWALVIEGTEPDLVRSACRKVLPDSALRRHGAEKVHRGLYRLLYGNDALRKDFT